MGKMIAAFTDNVNSNVSGNLDVKPVAVTTGDGEIMVTDDTAGASPLAVIIAVKDNGGADPEPSVSKDFSGGYQGDGFFRNSFATCFFSKRNIDGPQQGFPEIFDCFWTIGFLFRRALPDDLIQAM